MKPGDLGMRRIVGWKVLEHQFLDELRNLVSAAFYDDWEPFGSLVFVLGAWFQPIVRYAEATL